MGASESDRPSFATTAASEAEYQDLYRRLNEAVGRACPSWLSAHRDDIVQNALLRVMEVKRKRGEGGAPLEASYLWRVAYTTMVDQIRSIRRKRETSLEGETEAMAAPSASPSPEAASLGGEITAGVRECLDRLVPPRRRAVTLYLQGHTVAEASRLLDWGPKKVENLVYRGLANLRECLEARGLTL